MDKPQSEIGRVQLLLLSVQRAITVLMDTERRPDDCCIHANAVLRAAAAQYQAGQMVRDACAYDVHLEKLAHAYGLSEDVMRERMNAYCQSIAGPWQVAVNRAYAGMPDAVHALLTQDGIRINDQE